MGCILSNSYPTTSDNTRTTTEHQAGYRYRNNHHPSRRSARQLIDHGRWRERCCNCLIQSIIRSRRSRIHPQGTSNARTRTHEVRTQDTLHVHSSSVKSAEEETEGLVWDPSVGGLEMPDHHYLWEPKLETIAEETTEELEVLRQRGLFYSKSSTANDSYDFDMESAADEVINKESDTVECSL